MKLRIPSWASVALGLIAGIAAALNETKFGLGAEWRGYVSIALVYLAGLGISPLIGQAFRSALHLSSRASVVISTGLAALALAVHAFDLSSGTRGVLQAVLTFAAAIGFAPAAGVVLAGHIVVPRKKGGRLPAVWPAGVKSFLEYTTKLQAAPKSFKAVIKGALPMDGNDEIGDCTMAGVAHLIAALNWLFGKLDKVPTKAQIVAEYFKETGGKDTGLVEANVLKKWKTKGLFGNKIKLYAPVKVTDREAIKKAIAFYGGCYLGILCPESAQRQFAEHKPWTYQGEETEDGHCIVAIGYDEHGNLECATWGGVVLVTPGFLQHYLEEAWVILSDQLVKAGKDTLGLNTAQLEADLAHA